MSTAMTANIRPKIELVNLPLPRHAQSMAKLRDKFIAAYDAGLSLKDTVIPKNVKGLHLAGADLSKRVLFGRNWRNTVFSHANLNGAIFERSSLVGCSFESADLRDADLQYTDLSRAYFLKARVHGVKWPAPQMVLMANWYRISKELTIELMRYDAASHPDPSAFDRWFRGGRCPYLNCPVQRAANFSENRDWWSPGPAKGAYELMQMLLAECCDLTP